MNMSDYEHEEVLGKVETEISINDVEENNPICDEQDHRYVQNISADVELEAKANFVAKSSKVENVKRDRHSSELWTKFTIISRKYHIASCNICGRKLSFRSTTSNLKKHLIRKHDHVNSPQFTPYKPKFKHTPTARPKLSELESLILNVVGNEEEDPTVEIVAQEVTANEAQSDVHDYCVVGEEEPASKREFNSKIPGLSETRVKSSYQTNYTPSTSRDVIVNDRSEKMKKNRILDLQLECLELKRYIMKMENLLLEQQLNLPRSIYTENLISCQSVTRGTQTDVGGSNTKVFYVTNGQSSSMDVSQHLFSFQAHLQE